MELRGFRPLTRKAYLRHVRKFGEFAGQDPAQLGLEEVERYLLFLTRERGLSASTRNQRAAALRFLYGTTLKQTEWVMQLPFAAVPRKLPLVLSGTEVERLLASFESVTHQTIATLCYGAYFAPRGNGPMYSAVLCVGTHGNPVNKPTGRDRRPASPSREPQQRPLRGTPEQFTPH